MKNTDIKRPVEKQYKVLVNKRNLYTTSWSESQALLKKMWHA